MRSGITQVRPCPLPERIEQSNMSLLTTPSGSRKHGKVWKRMGGQRLIIDQRSTRCICLSILSELGEHEKYEIMVLDLL